MAFIKETTSVCAECLNKIPATVCEENGRVVMEKACPEHGQQSSLLAHDAAFYFRSDPKAGGCGPGGCGLFNHSCTLIFEITDKCNLTCPTCFTASSPESTYVMGLDEFEGKLDHLLASGKRDADIVQLSGGEPTVHPQLLEFIEMSFEKGVSKVYVNSNGIELGKSPDLAQKLSIYANRLQVYLQLDGFESSIYKSLRGAQGLLDIKKRAVENALAAGIYVLPVMTVTRNVNMDHIGPLIRFTMDRMPKMNTVMLQPAMYAGRYLGDKLFERVTVGEVAAQVEKQTEGLFTREDFGPIPCSDPNCFAMAVGMRVGEQIVPISRYFPKYETWADPNVADRIARFTDQMPQNMIATMANDEMVDQLLDLLTTDDENISFDGLENFFLICIKPFMDPLNYDQHRADKCCVHVVDRGGDPVSLCEYNTIRRPRGLT